MALTPSTMLALGTQAPDFSLPDVVSGKIVSLSDFKNKKAFLMMFICRHCPYVEHVKEELAGLGSDYQIKNVGIVAISSNDAKNYPDDAPKHLKTMAKELGFFSRFAMTKARKWPSPTRQPARRIFFYSMKKENWFIEASSTIHGPEMGDH